MQFSLNVPNRMRLREAAAYLGISINTLYRMTSKREIPFYKPNGKTIYFLTSDLDAWLYRNRCSAHWEALK